MEDWKVWANYYDKTYPSNFVKACDASKKRQEVNVPKEKKVQKDHNISQKQTP